MGRKSGSLLVALATFFAVASTTFAQAAIAITPGVGFEDDTFTVAGSGLTPAMALDINFESPTGTVFSTAALGKVVVVDPDGSFAFQFVPLDEFEGEELGTWIVQVCAAGTDDCVQTTFDIAGYEGEIFEEESVEALS